MFNKVQLKWKAAIKSLRGDIKKATDGPTKERLKRRLDFMRKVDMAVVVSAEDKEEEKFEKQGLDIKPHRKRLTELDKNGHDLEYKFKDADDPLQIVFVCAMWLTGFDAPSVSTLYLDKPQKDHTLMQTIAQAKPSVLAQKINGVEKKNGEVVDYYGVFRRLKKAIKDYGEGAEGAGEPPVKDKEELFKLLHEAVKHGKDFCAGKAVIITQALENDDIFKKVGLFNGWADKLLAKDEWRKEFAILKARLRGSTKPQSRRFWVSRWFERWRRSNTCVA